jgi:glycosyltransferase involved in cell wall biosynthesis
MGGAEAVLCDLISSMDNDVFDHHVLYIHDGPHRECLKTLNIPHYQITYGPLFLMCLMKHIQQIKPDVMHTLLWAANIAGRIAGGLLGVPVVSAWHNNLDQDGAMRNFFDRATYNFAEQHIAVSQGVINSARSLGFRDVDKAYVITNGINIRKIQSLSAQALTSRSAIALDQSHFVIGSVGRFVLVKRHDLMLKAFALLYATHTHARLVLVGIGEQESFLRTQAVELGIAQAVIFIVGKSSAQYYPLFDCFSLSSDKEGVSIALLEAMSFGLPSVMTHAEAKHAVIEQGVNGLLVPAGDVQKLADSWTQLIENKEMAHKLGFAARERVQSNFSSDRMCKEYEELFKKIVKG